MSRQGLGPTEFPVQLVQGSVPPVKWVGHEVNHTLPSSARVKKVWSYASTRHICFHFMCTGTTLPVPIWLYNGGLLRESKFFPEPLV